eukprot:Tbor_TRINITY_DN4803_c0_g1::TRINITY_DN4803_c0_g1_i1::g.1353::m.1353
MLRRVTPYTPPPLLHTSLECVDIIQLDMTGDITPMKITSRTFEIFDSKSLILELPLDPSTISSLPSIFATTTLSADYLIVADFEMLKKIHRRDYVYRLLPRKCRNTAAYAVCKEICKLPGSPFNMSHRVDPHIYRVGLRADADTVVKKWNEGLDAKSHNFTLPANSAISFDAMLISETANAVVLVNQQLNERAVGVATGSVEFMRHYAHGSLGKRITQTEIEALWVDFAKKRKVYYFIAGDRPPTREALGFANVRGVHMLSRFGQYFRYCV